MKNNKLNTPHFYLGILFLLFTVLSLVPGFEQKKLSIQVEETYYIVSYNVLFYALSFLFGAIALLSWFVSVMKNSQSNRL
ncbi:hypothetical protein GCM10028791_22570 [Echinicola sediminis]